MDKIDHIMHPTHYGHQEEVKEDDTATKPATPAAPVTPATPAAPTAPATPAAPATPVTPATPAAPVTPVTPAAPAAPATPATPAKKAHESTPVSRDHIRSREQIIKEHGRTARNQTHREESPKTTHKLQAGRFEGDLPSKGFRGAEFKRGGLKPEGIHARRGLRHGYNHGNWGQQDWQSNRNSHHNKA